MHLFRSTIFIVLFLLISSTSIISQDNIYAEINVDSAYSMVQSNINNPNFIILDVRTPGEYKPDHIENAVSLNYYNSDFKETLDTLIKTKKYLLHCKSGSRSAKAFKMMKDLKFKEVYNMQGGIVKWKNKAYPTTKEVFPILISVSPKDEGKFGKIDINEKDTINITITNFGNDTLKFSNFTDLSSTEFATDFDINKKLTGFDDYTFNIIYSPIDAIEDSVNFTLFSNGGELSYNLFGSGKNANTTFNTSNQLIVLYPNPTNSFINIESINDESISNIQILNIKGQLILKKIYNTKATQSIIDLSNFEKGLYIITIKSKDNVVVKRIVIK